MGVAMRVVEWLRSQGHDVLTFDLDFGEIAALTHDRVARVILFRLENTRAEHVVARLGAVLSASGDALNRGAILIVEETRHRIRYLPVREAEP
jgi:predicted nuclease of predicted toxin-antitoxin system